MVDKGSAKGFRLTINHLMPSLWYLDREPLRSGPMHKGKRAGSEGPAAGTPPLGDKLEELLRAPLFSPPGATPWARLLNPPPTPRLLWGRSGLQPPLSFPS